MRTRYPPSPLLLTVAARRPAQEVDGRNLLTFLQTPVVSASRSAEKLSEAPATVIVLSRADLEQRGYTELSQILDDLPGMDLSRSYGANYLKDYWRGYRNDIGDPFLVMVDGQTLNHLWYGTADTPLVTYPLAAIERVEIVYGPASSVYGANAFMGVINLITRKAPAGDGAAVRGSLTAGSFGTRIVDAQAAARWGRATLTLAVRGDDGHLDTAAADRYEFTRARYFEDPHIWGGFQGRPDSEHRNRAVDLRLGFGRTEFGFQSLLIRSGYGYTYPGDQSQSLGTWARPDTAFFLRHTEDWTPTIKATSLARYRRSDLANDSYDVESAYAQTGQPSAPGWRLFSYQSLNASLSFAQDFEIQARDWLALNLGLSDESRTLQKAYLYGVDTTRQDPPEGRLSDPNHFSVENRGIYAQARIRLGPPHQVHFGLRSDHNGIYGAATTLRGGYVGSFGAWSLKALYGQAYQEPTARQLYGATIGTGANPNLDARALPHHRAQPRVYGPGLAVSLDAYQVRNTGKIQLINGIVDNSGDQDVTGADLGFQWLVPGLWRPPMESLGLVQPDLQGRGPGPTYRRAPSPRAAGTWQTTRSTWAPPWTGTPGSAVPSWPATRGSRPTVISNPVGSCRPTRPWTWPSRPGIFRPGLWPGPPGGEPSRPGLRPSRAPGRGRGHSAGGMGRHDLHRAAGATTTR